MEPHAPKDRVAFYGGNPAKRKAIVQKKMKPYGKLDQYGTPRDVGIGDTDRLVRKISNESYDVVYIWTRFNNHNARRRIRDACSSTGTRVVEIESLSHISR